MNCTHPFSFGRQALAKSVAAATLALAALSSVADAQVVHNYSESPGIFAPSFRGGSNSAYFGWGPGSFDGATDNELIDGPATTLGTPITGASLFQSGTADILTGTNNIYTNVFVPLTLQIGVPVVGVSGSGFTTIIIQGSTLFGGFNGGADSFSFPTIGGATPTVTAGTNKSGQGQFWAKYEIAGNADLYNIPMTIVAQHTSMATLTVDSSWSASGFAGDTTIPEPGVAAMLGGVGALFLARRRRSAVQA